MAERVLGDFERMRGERQKEGDYTRALPEQLPADIPVRPAPPYPRQVISGYDARPIGGMDFVLSEYMNIYGGPTFTVADQIVTVIAPFGYVTVLRRVEIEGTPSIVAGADFTLSLLVDGITQPNWTWGWGSILDGFRAIDTFIVIPPNTPYGLFMSSPDLTADPNVSIRCRFIGNLILDTNIPANEQVGSLPTRVVPQPANPEIR